MAGCNRIVLNVDIGPGPNDRGQFGKRTIWRGLPCLNPVSVTNKSFKPTSMPMSGSDTGSNSQRQDTKYRPVVSLEMVTVDGADGNGRDQHTSKGALLFAIYSLPSRYLKALAVNSAACLWRLLLKVGYAARPAKTLEKAACWWRRDCWSSTQETSFSQANSGPFLSAVRRALARR